MFGLGHYNSFETFNLLITSTRGYYITEGNRLLSDDERVYANIIKRAVNCYAISLIDSEKKWKVKVVDCDKSNASDVGNILVEDKKYDFAAMFRYEILRDEWWLSLRANVESDIDLTEIVKHFGNGGGHPKASGFTIYGKDGHNLRTIFHPINNLNYNKTVNNTNNTNDNNTNHVNNTNNTN